MPRTRSARAHQQVLEAALKLFARQGIDATSMDAIAGASGVSKATIYKHWRDKGALCLEILPPPPPLETSHHKKTGDSRAAMLAILNRRPGAPRSALQDRLMPHLMAYAARNPAFAKVWRARMMQPARLQMREWLERSIAEGSLSPHLNLDVAEAMLFGPAMYRHVLSLFGRHLPENLVELVVDAFWRAHANPAPKQPKVK
jgi:hypothetical protein